LAIFILCGAGLVLAAVMFSSNAAQSRLLIKQQEREGAAMTLAAANRISGLLNKVEALAKCTMSIVQEGLRSREEAADLLTSLLGTQPEASGLTIAFAEGAKGQPFVMLRALRHEGTIRIEETQDASHSYMQDWFYLPRYMGRAGWVEPYFDEQGGETSVTYATPLFVHGELVAVVAVDLPLRGIREVLDSLELGESGLATLISSEGVYISHTYSDYEMRETMYSVAESLSGPGQPPLQCLVDLCREMLSQDAGMTIYKRNADDVPSYVYHRRIMPTGWALSVVFPEAQIMEPLRRQNKTNILIGLSAAALLLAASVWVAYSLTQPLHQLATAAGHLAVGDFDAPLPKVTRSDEIGRLTASFARMREDLHGYIDELTATTAAKEKIASELSIAHQIQLSIVPKLFPPFPDRHDLDLFAALEPAREVGGDLYDFSLLDEDHLYVAIGDVSGKGVPASLLMAVGKTLLKSTIHAVRDPGRALTMVNDELSADNESCMFITAFCGILNLHSGHFTFANAGHNPPLIINSFGMPRFLRRKPGPALGALSSIRYQNMDLELANSEMLLLYTDGVTEAMNPKDEMFGEDRMRELASGLREVDARTLVGEMVKAVHAHASGAEQSDDITLLAVRSSACRNPRPTNLPTGEPDSAIELPAKKEALELLVGWLEQVGEIFELSPALVMSLNLVLEEWFVNIVSYAFVDKGEHVVKIRMWKGPKTISLQIEDDGQPFDPTAQAAPNLDIGIEQRRIGGLGIHFIRKTVNVMNYSRVDGRNILTLVKNTDGASQAPLT
jgi:sigma-B regulation protein RsbU (phosphoserine phosphatase)